MRRLPLHPVLVGVFPVLFLWAQNADEVTTGDALGVLWRVVLGVVVVAALTVVAFRDVRRGALAASAVALATLVPGHVWDPEGGALLGLAITVVVVIAVVVGIVVLPERAVGQVTLGANVIAALLVGLNLPPVVAALTGPGSATADERPVVTATGGPGRDIVWIIPDRYGREDELQRLFGFDNGAFTGWLEARGFQVADEAVANYNKTAHSVASTLALDYLDDLAARVDPADGSDWGPVYAMLRHHEVGRILTEAGYHYVHLGSWWSPTSTATDADVVLNHATYSEFAQVFEETTVWPAVEALAGRDEIGDRERIRNHTEFGFDQLDRLAGEDPEQPRFILAHLTIPHEPYVFEADGSWVPSAVERERTRAQNYTRQVEYANLRLRGIVERFLDRPREEQPILVIQADEGPHPVEYVRQAADYHWPSAPVTDLREKLRILSASYLPGADAPTIPEDTTPVNTFRTILDWQLGTDLGRLPDRSFVFRDEHHLYEFTDVTARVR